MDEKQLLHLANELRVACQLISRRVRYEGTAEIAPHQASVLGKLRRGPLTLGELASAERVSAPSMTRTVNCLVEQGLVEKQPSLTDGRVVRVCLTDAGQAAMRRAITDRDSWMVSQLRELNEGQLSDLGRLVPLLVEVAHK